MVYSGALLKLLRFRDQIYIVDEILYVVVSEFEGNKAGIRETGLDIVVTVIWSNGDGRIMTERRSRWI